MIQLSLFERHGLEKERPRQLMQTVDKLNFHYGQDEVRFAVMGFEQPWQTRAQFRSNRWTTRWDELVVVKA